MTPRLPNYSLTQPVVIQNLALLAVTHSGSDVIGNINRFNVFFSLVYKITN